MTNSRLDSLLRALDPENVNDEVRRRADNALNSFPDPRAHLERWVEFTVYMGRLFRHVEDKVLRLRPPLPPDHGTDWPRCRDCLVRIYGGDGEKAAFEIARTGTEGGLVAVAKTLAYHVADHYGENEVRARIAHFLAGLSPDEYLAAAEEYLRNWGHLLPSELTEGGGVRIKARFQEVLAYHPRLLQRLRQETAKGS